MRRNKKGLSLVETMVAICVATLLFASLGSSFHMFKMLNNSAIKNSKKELSMMSIRDYIENNIENIVLEKANGVAFYVNVDELQDSYDMYYYDKSYYLVPSNTNKFSKGYGVSSLYTVGSIGVFDDEDMPVLTINGDYIIRFRVKEYNKDLRFYLVDYNDDDELIVPVFHFNDLAPEDVNAYYDEVGESIYYSNLYNDDSLFDGLFEPYSNSQKKLIMNIDGEQKLLFEKLPYESLNINFSMTTNTYRVADKDGTLIPTYGIEVLPNDTDRGVAYVEESDYAEGRVSLCAREIAIEGRVIKESPFIETGDEDDESYEPEVVYEDEIYSFEFLGWYTPEDPDLYEKDPYYQNYNISVPIPRDGDTHRYIAKFANELDVCHAGIDFQIDQELRYTYATKEVFTVRCDIDYSEMAEGNTIDQKKISFVPGIFYKYSPEVYTGERE